MKNTIIPIVSLVIGIIAFALTYKYLNDERMKLRALEERIYAGAQKIRVMGARTDIPSGTVIKPSDLGTMEVFKSSVGSHVVMPEYARMLFGKKAVLPIKGKDPIYWSHIEGGAASVMGLAPMIKHGMRAITLSVGGPNAVNGMIEPNDRVDILGTFTFPSKTAPQEMETVTLTVLQNVTVLAVGQRLAKDIEDGRGRRLSGAGLVTVEVSPEEAELLVFAQPTGQLTLALRNPSDMGYKEDLPEINFNHLETRLPELNMVRQRELGGRPLTTGSRP
jgi:pilus assembly protein CpaB